MSFFDFLSDKQLNNLAFSDLHFLNRRSEKELERILSTWMTEAHRISLSIDTSKEYDALFFQSLVRPDYNELFSTIIKSSSIDNYIYIKRDQIENNTINCCAIKFLSENLKILQRIQHNKPLVSKCLAVRLCQYAFIASLIGKLSIRCAIFFSDMQPMEYLCSLYLKKLDVVTVTTQHGLYIEYPNSDTVNVINYKNHASDYFLSWGKNTAELIRKHHPNANTVICGKPNLRKFYPNKNLRGFLVIFDQEIFREQNTELLKIVNKFAKSLSLNVLVKFHPSNNKSAYHKTFSTLREASAIDPSFIIVGHTSSLLFEAHSQGAKIMQYVTDVPSIYINRHIAFTNNSSFARAYERTTTKGTDADNNNIRYIGHESEAMYEAFFKSLLHKNSRPFFSIIIPSFNSSLTIIRCINALLAQRFENFEIIVVDGGSTDSTLPLLTEQYSENTKVKIYCQKDYGIYDAMNKGISYSRGEWLYFLGSDDELHNDDVLQEVHKKLSTKKCDFAYGSVRVVDDVKWAKDGTIYDGEFDDVKITKQNICHQAVFYRSHIISKFGMYDLKFSLCSDWDMNLRIWPKSRKLYLDMVVAKFFAGGASTSGGDPEFGKVFKEKLNVFQHALRGN